MAPITAAVEVGGPSLFFCGWRRGICGGDWSHGSLGGGRPRTYAGRTSGGGGRSRPLYGIADCGPGTTGTISKHVASIQETESDVGGGVGTGGVWNVRGRDCICSASAGAVRLGAGTSVGKYFRDFFGYARSSLP